MGIESLIQNFGYLAIFIGTFLEGETVLVLGGFAAHQNLLSLPLVLLSAFLGGVFGDQLYFFVGRWRAEAVLRRLPSWRAPLKRGRRLLERYQNWIVIGFRFLYGLRIVLPFAIGMSGYSVRRFVILNVIGAVLWATSVGMAGYFFGRALNLLFEEMGNYEFYVMAGIAVLGVLSWLFFKWLRRRRMKASEPDDRPVDGPPEGEDEP